MQKTVNSKLKWVERVSYLMDEKFRLPGTNFRFGLDPLINLIPFVGDLTGLAVSTAYKSNSRNIKLLKQHYEEGFNQ